MIDVTGVPLVSVLRRVLHAPAPAPGERCDLCAAELPQPHTHIVDIVTRRLLCVCRICATVGGTRDQPPSGTASTTGRYRVVPDRHARRASTTISAAHWEALAIPVDLAFFFVNSNLGRTVAFYPGPAGVTESLLTLEAWSTLTDANPWIETIAPDVEAWLVRRMDDEYGCFLVPIDVCYELAGRIRTHWSGLGGGERVRTEIDSFFAAILGESAGHS